MIFKRKKENIECRFCNGRLENNFDYCPYCGKCTLSPEQMQKKYGLLGNSDEIPSENPLAAAGILESILRPLMQGFVKSMLSSEHLDAQQLPNGISISIGNKPKKAYKQIKPLKAEPSKEQLEKMSNLPRISAKTRMKRLSDKIIYDLEAPGIKDIKDILVSKTESGYEIKAIAKNKVYSNSLPINLPLLQYSFNESGISLEFAGN